MRVLTDGAQDLPPRQQTMQRAIDWSYELLTAGERRLFGRMAVFVGGCTLEAAQAICDEGEDEGEELGRDPGGGAASDNLPAIPRDIPLDIVDGLTALLNESLIEQRDEGAGGVRFRMLETIREYGLARLAASGEMETVWTTYNVFVNLGLGVRVSSSAPSLKPSFQAASVISPGSRFGINGNPPTTPVPSPLPD